MKALCALLLFSVFLRGCCDAPPRVEPALPNDAAGWKVRNENGVRILGSFLLRKGEATRNNKIQVTLVDIYPGDPCSEAASYLRSPSTKLEFIRLSDHQVLCEDRFYEGQSGNLKCGKGLSEFGVLGISVNAINVKDGWVSFELLD